MDRYDGLLLLGVLLIAIGCGLIALPFGLIAGGAGCLAFALMGAKRSAGANRAVRTHPTKDQG